MRLVNFAFKDRVEDRAQHLGVLLEGDEILFAPRLSGDSGLLPAALYDLDGLPLRRLWQLHNELQRNGGARARLRAAGTLVPAASVRLLAPVPAPGKIICMGINYRDHAEEAGLPIPKNPVIFSKFATSVIGPDEPIILPPSSSQVDYEAELAVIIGRRAKHVSQERAMEHVLGYTILNDVSARDFQFGDGQWVRGKSCDTFAPMGPWLVTADEIADPHTLDVQLRLNGEVMQDSNTRQLIFRVPEIISFLSQTITLEPGDVIATGTPPGVGFVRKPPVFLKPGDTVEIQIQKVGILRSVVASAAYVTDAKA